MSIEVKVPDLPESVSDGTLMNWHKRPGEGVKRDENLVDLETDKVVLEIPAPADGVLSEIRREDGETVTTGDVIAILEAGEGVEPAGEVEAAAEKAPEAAGEVDEAALSPAVRRLVAEHGLDAGKIRGSGRGGRITKEDVLNYVQTGGAGEQVKPKAEARAEAKPAEAKPERRGRIEQRVAMTRLRARIAERLLQAKHSTAMLTTFNEVDMQPVMALRARYKDKFEQAHGVRLGFMSFFVKAAIEALKRFPAVNGSIDGNDIIYHGYYDIGIAVSSPRGLVVPILRDADQMSFAEIEKTIADFGQRAKAGSLSIEEMSGGTFTITNGGVFGSLLSTPILNPPQSGILGMHKTQERAVVEAGQVVVRPMMYLAHSYDHRIIDGREAVTFLVVIKECLEDPARLLLEV